MRSLNHRNSGEQSGIPKSRKKTTPDREARSRLDSVSPRAKESRRFRSEYQSEQHKTRIATLIARE
jgi:hypothetical protein